MQLTDGDENCVLKLCVYKTPFGKSGHKLSQLCAVHFYVTKLITHNLNKLIANISSDRAFEYNSIAGMKPEGLVPNK